MKEGLLGTSGSALVWWLLLVGLQTHPAVREGVLVAHVLALGLLAALQAWPLLRPSDQPAVVDGLFYTLQALSLLLAVG